MTASPWTSHRRRAAALRQRYPFAAELLDLYLPLLEVWDDAWALAREDRPAPGKLAAWATERVLPQVVTATGAAGPQALAAATRDLVAAGQAEDVLAAWLADEDLNPVARYVARASLHPVLVALDDDAGPASTGDRRCPHCGGLPQLSYRADAQDPLVSGRRYLACARCAHSWSYSASACPSCGDSAGGRRTVYAERRAGPVVGRDTGDPDVTFPHLRIEGCASCQRYLIDVDLGCDPEAVAEVDELAAVPLDLYATERGLSKITPNLLGF